MNWLKLSEVKAAVISRGTLIKFTASYPFESKVVMMVCEAPHTRSSFGLITITGYKAGINCYVVLPDSARSEDATISTQWLYDVGPAKFNPTRRHRKAKAQYAVLSWAFIVSSRWNMSPMGAL